MAAKKDPIEILSMRKKYSAAQTFGADSSVAVSETITNPYWNDNWEDAKHVDCMLIESARLRFDQTDWISGHVGADNQLFAQLQYGNRTSANALVAPNSIHLFAQAAMEAFFASGVGFQVVPNAKLMAFDIVPASNIVVVQHLTSIIQASVNHADYQSKPVYTDIYYYKARVPHNVANAMLNAQQRTG